MYKESFLMAWASLIANKMRSILTMLGIIIGVAAVIALVSIGNGVKQDIQNSISSLGSNLLMVMPGAPRTPGVRPSAGSMKSLKVSDYEAISKLDGVKAASPMTNGSYVVIYQNKNWTTSVSGVSYNYLDVNNWSMKSGRFLSEKNVQNRERVAVVGKTVVKNLFGDEDPVGAEIRVKNIPFRIIGVLNSKGSGAMGNDQDDMVIMLVSVTERTREIGVRKALGATYSVIVTQFLIEAVVISLMGGIIGIILGIGSSKLIGMASGMSTVISVPTIVMSFAFSMAIGLIFGIYPARKAAKLNPIDALHYE